jgi:hypothetical protein
MLEENGDHFLVAYDSLGVFKNLVYVDLKTGELHPHILHPQSPISLPMAHTSSIAQAK